MSDALSLGYLTDNGDHVCALCGGEIKIIRMGRATQIECNICGRKRQFQHRKTRIRIHYGPCHDNTAVIV